jgi:hypothetical protein
VGVFTSASKQEYGVLSNSKRVLRFTSIASIRAAIKDKYGIPGSGRAETLLLWNSVTASSTWDECSDREDHEAHSDHQKAMTPLSTQYRKEQQGGVQRFGEQPPPLH